VKEFAGMLHTLRWDKLFCDIEYNLPGKKYTKLQLKHAKPNRSLYWWWWCYPTPSEGRVGTIDW